MDVISYILGLEAGKKSSGDGIELNIAYGDTAPEDTTKLWVKTSEPSKVIVTRTETYKEGGAGNTVRSMPFGRLSAVYNGEASVYNNRIYIFGGYNDNNAQSNKIDVFDPIKETIEKLSVNLPAIRNGGGSITIGEKIYFVGGYWGNAMTKIIRAFDPTTNTFTTMTATLPERMDNMAIQSVGTKAYIFGGGYSSSYYNTILVYDTETDALSTLTGTVPEALQYTQSALINGFVYLFGGQWTSAKYSTKVYKFDPITETISTLRTSIPVSGRILGGQVGNNAYLAYDTTLYEFNGDTETFTKVSVTLPVSVDWFQVSASVNNQVWFFQGFPNGQGNTIFFYSPKEMYVDVTRDELLITTLDAQSYFTLTNSPSAEIDIGVKTVYKGNAEGKGEPVEAALYTDGTWTTI